MNLPLFYALSLLQIHHPQQILLILKKLSGYLGKTPINKGVWILKYHNYLYESESAKKYLKNIFKHMIQHLHNQLEFDKLLSVSQGIDNGKIE